MAETFTENWLVRQYEQCLLIKETSAGVWESNAEFKVVDPNQAVLDVIGTDEFTAQQLIDMASGSGGNAVVLFAEDEGVAVDTVDLETNIDHLTVESDGTKYLNSKLT